MTQCLPGPRPPWVFILFYLFNCIAYMTSVLLGCDGHYKYVCLGYKYNKNFIFFYKKKKRQ
jgi:hypothetical protein